MTEPRFLDPEVEALLREVAADPRSTLLRFERPDALTGLAELRPDVGSNAAGLHAAERELLRVHRAELSLLLREACLARLLANQEAQERVGREIDTRRRVEVPDPEDWLERARAALEEAGDDSGTETAHEVLERCVRADGAPSVAQLAAASLRVLPHDSARVYAGVDLCLRGEPHTARRVFEGVLAGCPAPLQASNAWENLAWSLSESGAEEQSLRAYGIAAQLGDPRSTPHFSWLFKALKLDREAPAREAAARIDAHFKPGHSSLEPWLGGIAARRERGDWTPPPTAPAMIARLEGSFGPNSRRVADALL